MGRDYNAEIAELLHEAAHPWRGCTEGERNKLWKKFERALLAAPSEELGEELRTAQLVLKRDLGLTPKTEGDSGDPSEGAAYALEQAGEFANMVVSEVVQEGVMLPYSPKALHLRVMMAVGNTDKQFLHEAIQEIAQLMGGPDGLERLERRVRGLGYVPPEGEVLPNWSWQQQ